MEVDYKELAEKFASKVGGVKVHANGRLRFFLQSINPKLEVLHEFDTETYTWYSKRKDTGKIQECTFLPPMGKELRDTLTAKALWLAVARAI